MDEYDVCLDLYLDLQEKDAELNYIVISMEFNEEETLEILGNIFSNDSHYMNGLMDIATQYDAVLVLCKEKYKKIKTKELLCNILPYEISNLIVEY